MPADGSILFTMRIKTDNWERMKSANDQVFGDLVEKAKESGLISSKVYRSEGDPSDVLFVSEWRSHEDMHKFGEEHGDKFNEIAGVNPDDWEDVAWKLTDAKGL